MRSVELRATRVSQIEKHIPPGKLYVSSSQSYFGHCSWNLDPRIPSDSQLHRCSLSDCIWVNGNIHAIGEACS